MTAVAFLETRTILVSGTLETSDRAVMVTYDLPSEGEWTFIKVETNLSDQSWSSWIMSVDEMGNSLRTLLVRLSLSNLLTVWTIGGWDSSMVRFAQEKQS